MRSVDTNVILRILLRDDPEQERLAHAILAGPCFLLSTVVLETVWVLTGKGWPSEDIAHALRGLLDLEKLVIADETAFIWVVERFASGGDFADMLHVALSGRATAFTTFDRKLERYCPGGPVSIETMIAA